MVRVKREKVEETEDEGRSRGDDRFERFNFSPMSSLSFFIYFPREIARLPIAP